MLNVAFRVPARGAIRRWPGFLEMRTDPGVDLAQNLPDIARRGAHSHALPPHPFYMLPVPDRCQCPQPYGMPHRNRRRVNAPIPRSPAATQDKLVHDYPRPQHCRTRCIPTSSRSVAPGRLTPRPAVASSPVDRRPLRRATLQPRQRGLPDVQPQPVGVRGATRERLSRFDVLPNLLSYHGWQPSQSFAAVEEAVRPCGIVRIHPGDGRGPPPDLRHLQRAGELPRRSHVADVVHRVLDDRVHQPLLWREAARPAL